MPSQSKEIQPFPWLAPNVIKRLEEIVKPHFRVIEHGCGGSTLWFSTRASQTIAFDNKPDWVAIVNEKITDHDRARVFVNTGDIRTETFTDKFDLLLIDGEPLEERGMWLDHATDLVKKGGWVVLDNANRPHFAAAREMLKKIAVSVETFDGNEGGTLYLVTEFYRL